MIFGNEKQLKDFAFLDKRIQACFEYAKTHDLMSMTPGFHEIDGDDFYVNLCEYTTTTVENRFWEAHRQYLDIHYMVDGAEQIDFCFIENMKQGEFVPAQDFLPMEGESVGSLILKKGDFLVCYPHDGHRTAIQVSAPQTIRKAIFKVRI